jgi:hypothetical protein
MRTDTVAMRASPRRQGRRERSSVPRLQAVSSSDIQKEDSKRRDWFAQDTLLHTEGGFQQEPIVVGHFKTLTIPNSIWTTYQMHLDQDSKQTLQ